MKKSLGKRILAGCMAAFIAVSSFSGSTLVTFAAEDDNQKQAVLEVVGDKNTSTILKQKKIQINDVSNTKGEDQNPKADQKLVEGQNPEADQKLVEGQNPEADQKLVEGQNPKADQKLVEGQEPATEAAVQDKITEILAKNDAETEKKYMASLEEQLTTGDLTPEQYEKQRAEYVQSIKEAIAAYEALSDEQKALVTNYEELAALLAELEPVDEAAEIDMETVNVVIGMIDALTVSAEEVSQFVGQLYYDMQTEAITQVEFTEKEAAYMQNIWSAMEAYEALSDEQKALVTNYGKLESLLMAYYNPTTMDLAAEYEPIKKRTDYNVVFLDEDGKEIQKMDSFKYYTIKVTSSLSKQFYTLSKRILGELGITTAKDKEYTVSRTGNTITNTTKTYTFRWYNVGSEETFGTASYATPVSTGTNATIKAEKLVAKENTVYFQIKFTEEEVPASFDVKPTTGTYDGTSGWDVIGRGIYRNTSQDVTVSVDEDTHTITYTIGENASGDLSIDLNPIFRMALSYYVPGDYDEASTLVIVNNSSHTYAYQNGSFEMVPVNMSGETDTTFGTGFDGQNIATNFSVYRTSNKAIEALFGKSSVTVKDMENLYTFLEAAGYPGGAEQNALTKFYLDFYNSLYSTDATTIETLPLAAKYDILGHGAKNVVIKVKEVESEIAAFGYNWFYNNAMAVTMDYTRDPIGKADDLPAYSVGSYMNHNTAAYQSAEAVLSNINLAAGGSSELPNIALYLDGLNIPNAYQGYNFGWGCSIVLVQADVPVTTPDDDTPPSDDGGSSGGGGGTPDEGDVLGATRRLEATIPEEGQVLGAVRAAKTSDSSKAILWMLVMSTAAAGAGAMLAKKKEKERV